MNKKEQITPMKRFWLLLKPNQREIRQVYAFAILNGLVALSLPLGIQSIVNLIQGGQVSTSWVVLVILVLIGIGLGGLLQILQLRITENLQQTIFTKAAFEFAFRIPRIKLKELYDEYAPELVNRFFDTNTIQKGLSKILIDFSTAIFQIVLGLLLLSLYHPFFIAISIVLIILSYLILKLTGNQGLETSLKESKYKYLVAHWLEEIARANTTFKLAGENDLTLRKTDTYVSSYLDARESHFSVLKTQYVYLTIFKIIVAGMLLAIGGILVINQQMNIGQFIAAELIILLILNSVEKLILSLETIYDVL
ncbi:MAG: ABC transporter transmembrane domain-containing protein, partial [Bacteroidia bacterium]